MGFKEFFRKNLVKSLALTLILLIISTLITAIIPLGIQTYGIPFARTGDTPSYGYFPPKTYEGLGFPIMFYAYTYGEWPRDVNPSKPLYNYYNFIISIIFWYLASCLIISVYHKIKKPAKAKSKKRKRK